MVPADPISPPLGRGHRRTRGPGQGLQHLLLQYLWQRFHLSWNPVSTGRIPNGTRPVSWTLYLAGLNRNIRKLDESKLIWGQEKILSKGVERVGETTQRFVIDVQ